MIKLSPSSLNLFLECPRCFWLRFNKGISRPSGPSSTLPSGMDYTLKNYYDYCRKNGLPPQLKGLIKGKLISDQEKVSEMRKRSFGFELNKDVWFGGALDEALEFEDDSIVPLDNKTKGFPPKESHWTQKMQMSGYTLILKNKSIKTKNLAYLVHWFLDHKNMNLGDPFKFNVTVEEVETNPDEIKSKILDAVKCLNREIPKPSETCGMKQNEICPFCKFHNTKI